METQLTLEQLKARAFDCIATIEHFQTQLREIQTMINKLVVDEREELKKVEKVKEEKK